MGSIPGWDMSIYKITNRINNKCLIGKTTQQPELRWYQHLILLRKNKHYNKYFQAAWNKDGEENFTFEVIEKFDPEMNFDLNNLERYWIKHFDSMNSSKGYNLTEGGEGGALAPEALAKMKKALKGRIPWNKGKKSGVVAWNKGKKMPSGMTEKRLQTIKEKYGKLEAWNKGLKGSQIAWNKKKVKGTNVFTFEVVFFDSVSLAAKHVNGNCSKVSAVCLGKRAQYKGWRFEHILKNPANEST